MHQVHVVYTATFIRSFKKLDTRLQKEVEEKIELFKSSGNHVQLKLHKLHGEHKKYHAFSVNYHTRVIVRFSDEHTAVAFVVDVGDHSVYE
jgi:mRNA-degrading endonuclease RelE of RelBE toxin-antitoxin system